MEMRSVNLIECFIALLIIFTPCVLARRLPLPVESPVIDPHEGSVPDIPGEDVRPPFGEPKLGIDDFDEFEGHGAGFIPPEYDYKNMIDEDFGKDFNKEDKIPEKLPDDGFDREPGKEASDVDKKGDHDDDDDNSKPIDTDKDKTDDVDKLKPDDIDDHKPDDDHGSGESFDAEEDFDKDIGKPESNVPDEHSHDKDFDEPHDDDSDDFDVEDRTKKPIDIGGEPDDEHIDKGIDKDVDDSIDDDDDDDDDDFKVIDEFPYEEKDAEEVPDLDDETGGAYPYGSFIFETPFFNMRQVSKYFQQLEKALEQVFRQSMEEATLLNGTYANTTEEEIDIDGKKYLVQKSIIKGKDNNNSIYIEALSKMPKRNKNETKAKKGSGM